MHCVWKLNLGTDCRALTKPQLKPLRDPTPPPGNSGQDSNGELSCRELGFLPAELFEIWMFPVWTPGVVLSIMSIMWTVKGRTDSIRYNRS
ncbi:hypothetical protein RRG08_022480 [Elysia crispata]|uniref:Uncharacterized protein n=1 Tax=Elysia crispata TaxID=231223 RepID=A0AAE0Z2H5_9GAST|nr:hypothetical protein RRG08_022480 [Elysia crispata]